ncbi:MAG: protease HtpX [Caldiserica bacterium]|nr:MAG: protease HtpX [Caldisericota bacterium]
MRLRTFLLMLSMTLLLVFVGNLVAGKTGSIFAFLIASFMNFMTYWYSDKIVLSMYRAKRIYEDDFPEIYSIVRDVSRKAGIKMPDVYLIEEKSPNAFATGRGPEKSAVALTTGIIEILNRDEFEGVIGHEISHIKNRDTLISTIAATLAGAIMMLASIARWLAFFGGFSRDDEDRPNLIVFLIIAILAPIAAMLIQMAISRQREYMADEGSAKITGKPLSLAKALSKLHESLKYRRMQVNHATAHLFIVNPLRGDFISNLFSTHPPVEKRIERLKSLAF